VVVVASVVVVVGAAVVVVGMVVVVVTGSSTTGAASESAAEPVQPEMIDIPKTTLITSINQLRAPIRRPHPSIFLRSGRPGCLHRTDDSPESKYCRFVARCGFVGLRITATTEGLRVDTVVG